MKTRKLVKAPLSPFAKLGIGIAALAGVALFVKEFPPLRRYLRMERM